MRPPLAVKSRVAHLAVSIRHLNKELEPIARRIAQIIDEEYHLTDYDECDDKEEIQHGIQFIIIATAIGSLHTLVDNLEGDQQRYALNLDAVSFPKLHSSSFIPEHVWVSSGEFSSFLCKAVHQGIHHHEAIWAAALLWGGASNRSQGYRTADERVLGVVAPQCTVISELLREPLLFATQGLRDKLLSIHRGSVLILPRDPKPGYVHPSKGPQRVRSAQIDCNVEGLGLSGRCGSELVITFEPDVLDGSMASIFCGWLAGELVFELGPFEVLNNLLMRRYDPTEIVACPNTLQPLRQGTAVRNLGCQELAKRGRYYPHNGVVVLPTHADPAWLIAGAGCVERASAVVLTGEVDLSEDGPLRFSKYNSEKEGYIIEKEDTILLFPVANPSQSL